ncbi:MAG: K(+)-transporting ATPase subunit F [Gemmatimonadetes bacterium]|nr:K(+)-transporting ATPase subunit F [Gemmatimonadota bacterium]
MPRSPACTSASSSASEALMYIVAAFVAVALFVYLLVALFRPEVFE